MARLPNGVSRMLCALPQFGSVVSAVNRPSPATARTRRSGPRTALSNRFSSESSSTRSCPETTTSGAPIMSSQKIGPSSFASRVRFCTGAEESSDSMLPTTGLVGGRGIGLSLFFAGVLNFPLDRQGMTTSSSAKPLSTPFDQLGADFVRLFLLRPMAAVPHHIFLEIRDDLLHAVGGGRRQHRVLLRHDHQRRYAHGVVEVGRALPVAREIAIPVDAAGEAGLLEGVDEHLLFLRREDRRARIEPGIIGRYHLRKGEVEFGRGADAGRRRLRRPGVRALERFAHEGVEGLFDAAVENPVRLAGRVLELDDIHLLAKALAEQLDRIDRRAIGMRRVDADHACDTRGTAERHPPDDKAAPVVADENRLVDPEMIEQADEVKGQMLEVVGLDRLGAVGRAITALVRRDHPDARFAQRLDLVTPGEGELRPAVAQYQRRLVRLGTRIVVAHANPVRLRELKRRHFNHYAILYSAVPLMSEAGGA